MRAKLERWLLERSIKRALTGDLTDAAVDLYCTIREAADDAYPANLPSAMDEILAECFQASQARQ